MDRYQLSAAPRDQVGKIKVKRLRREGLIPAVMYGRGIEPTPLQVDAAAFQQMVKSVGTNVLVDLTVEGSAVTTAMIKKVQRDPLSLAILNIDFYRVAVTDVITSRVPVELVGEPQGVALGGTLLQPTVEVDIRGVAANLPPSLQADVSHLGIDESLTIADLTAPEGIEILTPAEEVVAAVHAPRAAVEEPVPAEEITEPELVVEEKSAE